MKKLTQTFPEVKALVADDYFINLELVKDLLELMGCTVDIANNGKEALDKATENSFDIIFLDIQMPLMDGYDVVRHYRKHEAEEQHTPVIAITANALRGDEKKCLDAGMDAYLSKPIRGEKLEEILLHYFPKQNT
jgi:two-component system sensor histidine kinase/response regulator